MTAADPGARIEKLEKVLARLRVFVSDTAGRPTHLFFAVVGLLTALSLAITHLARGAGAKAVRPR